MEPTTKKTKPEEATDVETPQPPQIIDPSSEKELAEKKKGDDKIKKKEQKQK